jgi:enoyl-CoA hydratase/carnithine racemase
LYKWIKKDVDEQGVCTVTLDRAPVNAVNQEMYAEIRHVFSTMNTDRSVKVAILTGAGPRAFCGGNDLQEFRSLSPYNGDDRMRLVREAFFSIYDCAVPVIGAINGPAIGTGLGLAANCDVLFAAETATFGLPEINVGVLGGGAFGARMAGPFVMRRMFFSGEPISAEEMAQHGAVSQVVPAADLMKTVQTFAEGIAGRSSDAVRLAKLGLNLCESMDIKNGYTMEQTFTARLSGYPAAKESLSSILEHRSPDFASLPVEVDPVPTPDHL